MSKKHKKRHRSDDEEVKQGVTEEEKTSESLLFNKPDSQHIPNKRKHKKKKRKVVESFEEEDLISAQPLDNRTIVTNDNDCSVAISEEVPRGHKRHKKKHRKKNPVITNEGEPAAAISEVDTHVNEHHKMKKKKNAVITTDNDCDVVFSEEVSRVHKHHKKNAVITTDNDCDVAISEVDSHVRKHHKKKKKTRVELNVESNEGTAVQTVNGSETVKNVSRNRLRDDLVTAARAKKALNDKMVYFNNETTRSSMLSLRKKLVKEELSDVDSEEEMLSNELDIEIDWELSGLHQMSSLKVNRKTVHRLKAKGVKLRKGVWSREEELVLEKNWEEFKKLYKLHNPSLLLGLRKGYLKKGQATNFTRFLGRGLENRTLISIYQQARRMLNPANYKGRLIDLEERAVRRLVTEYGHKWEKIGRMLGRTGESVRTTWERTRDRYKNHGHWSESEDRRLVAAMAKATGEKRLIELEHHNLPWKEIAAFVRTRNSRQCRLHWTDQYITRLEQLAIGFNPNLKGTIEESKEWTKTHKIKLLNTLDDNGYLTEIDIPWDDLAKDFGFANCSIMRNKWHRLRTKVPKFYIKTFREILDWLMANYLQILEVKNKVKLPPEENDIR